MKLKALVIAALVAAAFIMVPAPQAKAEGPVVSPFASFASWMGYETRSKEMTGGKSDTDLDMNVVPQLNFGVRGMANNVTVMVSAMSSPFGATKAEQDQFQLFLVFAEYRTPDFGLTFGKAGTPYTCLNFNNVGPGVGSTLGGWDLFLGFDMFEAFPYQVKFDTKGFFIDLIRNTAGTNPGTSYVGTQGTTDVMLPKIVVGYTFGNPMAPVMFNVSGFYQTYKIDDGSGAFPDGENIVSYAASGFVKMNMQGLGITLHGHYSVNGGDMGYVAQPGADLTTGEIKDSTNMGGHAGISYTIDKVRPSAGVAYAVSSNDLWDKDDPKMAFFVACAYMMQPNLTLTPIFQLYDNMKDNVGVKQGTQTNYGVFVQANI